MASVYFDRVTKKFGNTMAVDDLTLEVRDKEFLVLVGPSGCGKSTVIRVLAGLEDATSGDVYLDGERVNDLSARDRDVAMVFQSYALYPHMSVFDNMAFGLRMHRTPRDEIRRRVENAAQALGISELLRRKPAQLSGGQRQRVALGRAIVREPKVFLFDEPLSNLDAKLRVQTRTELSKLHERLGTTFIYVTHDQVEALTMATRLAVLKDGILQQVGTPDDLYFRPDNVFVAGFIGSPSMNLLEGKLTGTVDDMAVEFSGFRVPIAAERARGLAEHLGKKVTGGIRPEDIHDEAFIRAQTPGEHISGHVDVTEMMGNERFLYLIVGEDRLMARVDSRTSARAGQNVQLMLDIDRLHLFSEEGLALDKLSIDQPLNASAMVRPETSPADPVTP
ncbi:MAG: ABC transporter ATP-binding protein [Dehalococcoidia bacterium]